MAGQLRYSAGTYLDINGVKIILDPGPGTLLRCARTHPPIDASQLDAIILSHAHIDHSGDVNAMIDAMTCGGWDKRGKFFAPQECLVGENRILLNYIKKAPEEIVQLEAKSEYSIDHLRFNTSPPHQHDVETYGLKFHLDNGILSFVTDTLFFDNLPNIYKNSKWMVINVVRQTGYIGRKFKHLCMSEAETLIGEIQPEWAVLTHFGMSIVNANPGEMADEISRNTGVNTIAARDDMRLDLV